MNLSDPFAGYRLAYGNTIIHFAYFIALFFIKDKNPVACKTADYVGAKNALLVSHCVMGCLSYLGFFTSKSYNINFIEKLADTFCLFIYHAVIFFAQS